MQNNERSNQKSSLNNFIENLQALRSLISKQLGIFLAMVILASIFASISPAFRSITNIQNVLVNVSLILIVAFSLNLIMISGGIDLSVGSTMGFAATAMAAAIVQYNVPSFIGIIIGLIAALIVGVVNGLLITRLKLPPFLITLGMLILVRGLCYVTTRYLTIQLTEEFAGKLIIWLGKSKILGIPFTIFIAIIIFIIIFIIQSKTVIGRNLYLIGGNEEVASISGINVAKTKMVFYVVTSLTAGISGILLAGILQSAQSDIGTGMEFRAITAIVVGGTSFYGGKGNVIGTVFGAILVGMVFNFAVILNLPFYVIPVLEGSIIILAVTLDTQVQKRSDLATLRRKRL